MNKAILLLVIVVLGFSVYAQCPIEKTYNSDHIGYYEFGQTFSPLCDGQIESIDVMIGFAAVVTDAILTIYDNTNNPPTVNAQTYTQSVTLSTVSHDVTNMVLTTPYPVNNGSHYCFTLKEDGGSNDIVLRYSGLLESYAGESYYYNDGVSTTGYHATNDLRFKVDIQAIPISPAVPITFLGLIAALALIGFGMLVIKR